MLSAILLSFGRGSGWDQLLYVITELPASFLTPVPRFDPLCMGACNVQPPLMPNQAGYALRRDLKLKLKLKLKVVFGGQTRVLFIMSIPG